MSTAVGQGQKCGWAASRRALAVGRRVPAGAALRAPTPHPVPVSRGASGEDGLGFLELCLHEPRSPLAGEPERQSLAKLHLEERVTPQASRCLSGRPSSAHRDRKLPAPMPAPPHPPSFSDAAAAAAEAVSPALAELVALAPWRWHQHWRWRWHQHGRRLYQRDVAPHL